MTSSEITVGIIGAGLAGILTARTCLENKIKIAWILDRADPERGSGVPTGLCHPFPGRSVQAHPLLEDAVIATTQMFAHWKKQYPNLLRETSIVRPFVGKGGERLKNSYRKTYIEEAKPIPSWLHLSYNQQANPRFLCDDTAGSVVYSPAFAVDLAELLSFEREFFSVQHVPEKPDRFVYSDKWYVWNHNNPESKWHADVVILCLGRGMNELFPRLQLGEYGGEMLMCDLPAEFDELYSANGRHIGRHHSGKYVFGATRWIEKRKPQLQESQQNLIQGIGQLLPTIKTMGYHSIWRGYRSVYHKDRLPISGHIPNLPKMYTCCALGSKGLLWGTIASQHCILEIKKHSDQYQPHTSQNKNTSTYLSTHRISEERWMWNQDSFSLST
jgi:glycine/D-amino acid oxidase-like deaminating enzyme